MQTDASHLPWLTENPLRLLVFGIALCEKKPPAAGAGRARSIDQWFGSLREAEPDLDLLAQYASDPRLIDHRRTVWHLVAAIINMEAALRLVGRGTHRLGRCAVTDCDRIRSDLTTLRMKCSPRRVNTDTV